MEACVAGKLEGSIPWDIIDECFIRFVHWEIMGSIMRPNGVFSTSWGSPEIQEGIELPVKNTEAVSVKLLQLKRIKSYVSYVYWWLISEMKSSNISRDICVKPSLKKGTNSGTKVVSRSIEVFGFMMSQLAINKGMDSHSFFERTR